jgi:protein involved in polysaccharide export with SLBB domain
MAATLRSFLVLSPLLWLGACAMSVHNAVPLAELGELERGPPGPYSIAVGDELEVRFFHTPELDTTVIVRPDGRVSIPFAQGVLAAGRTPENLSQELMQLYATELRDPEIAVIVRTFAGHRFHVGGEVDEPGVYPLVGSTTVLEAIWQAGGMLETAYTEQVIVLRPSASRSSAWVDELAALQSVRPRLVHVASEFPDVDPYPYLVLVIDFDAIVSGEDTSQNIELLPYDAVFVPRSGIAEVNLWVDQYIRRNIPVDVGIRPEVNF